VVLIQRRLSLTVAGATLGSIWGNARAARPDNRPDIIVVVVDYLRWDEYGAGRHPYLKTLVERLRSDLAKLVQQSISL
jgi:hypothetical protein